MHEEKMKSIKKIIDAEAYSGGILERAHDMTLSKDDKVIENIMIASRCKGKSHKYGRM